MAYYECSTGNTELTLSEWSEEIKYGEILHIPTSAKVIFLACSGPIYDPNCQQYPSRNQLNPDALLGKTPNMTPDGVSNNVVMSLSKSSGTETYRLHGWGFNGYNYGISMDATIDWDARVVTSSTTGSGIYGIMYCTLS